MTEQDDLKHRFRTLASAVPQKASPDLEDRVRTAFRVRVNQKVRLSGYVARVAASAGLAAGLYLVWTQWTQREGSGQQAVVTAPVRQRSEFIALPYAESEVPLEQPVIVRVHIPVSELGVMGVLFAPATGGVCRFIGWTGWRSPGRAAGATRSSVDRQGERYA